ncbi:thiopurine S-methyltransferase [Alteromonas ponticola]|uniref:Thiopurine S-methyltransferase n=1 Tax=Alteromonas aquimaris TaxID=2998417 RepID=A0ABT3P720_9ALTE|nr:thiopurine S-methyltransferase [Alteromonas aquimaris]MCW8108529.1 thiopurine S-methyltransferase [Alteromonas aquimaris]
MEKQFWIERWESEEIAFHEDTVNTRLIKYIQRICPMGGHVFVPLCGKTLDIGWLLENGYTVTAVELSRKAIEALFAQLQLTPTITTMGKFVAYSAPAITVYEGDFFDLKQIHLLDVDCIYDRASLVALPPELRNRYIQHLPVISSYASQLLITVDYDRSLMDGPPFAITGEDIRSYYAPSFSITALETSALPAKLKGKCEATSSAWLLTKREDT